MDIKVVEVELKRMKEVMDNMNTESKSKDERYLWKCKIIIMNRILLYAAKNIDELSTDEKRKVYTESILASMNRDKLGGVKMMANISKIRTQYIIVFLGTLCFVYDFVWQSITLPKG